MKVLVACEESQRVCVAFRELGHEAYSCDIQEPSGGHLEWHIKGDAIAVLNGGGITTLDGAKHQIDKWDVLIAHPPCTYLSNAGVRHLFAGHKLNQERYNKGLKAKEFFLKFLNADIEMICVENPVPSKVYEMPPYTQIVQPYMFGHPYSKKTCLWLKGLPKLSPTNLVPIEQVISTRKADWFQKGSLDSRRKSRSKTFEGIAKAMAEQWGGDIRAINTES